MRKIGISKEEDLTSISKAEATEFAEFIASFEDRGATIRTIEGGEQDGSGEWQPYCPAISGHGITSIIEVAESLGHAFIIEENKLTQELANGYELNLGIERRFRYDFEEGAITMAKVVKNKKVKKSSAAKKVAKKKEAKAKSKPKAKAAEKSKGQTNKEKGASYWRAPLKQFDDLKNASTDQIKNALVSNLQDRKELYHGNQIMMTKKMTDQVCDYIRELARRAS